jgi:hypothetical protein
MGITNRELTHETQKRCSATPILTHHEVPQIVPPLYKQNGMMIDGLLFNLTSLSACIRAKHRFILDK